MKCEKCSSEMIYKIEGRTQGWFCQKCGNAIVTSYFSEMELDQTNYEIIVLNSNTSLDNIKLISKIKACNFIEAKSLLMNGGTVANGLAREIMGLIDKLKDSRINYKIVPNFPYK